MGKMGNIYSLHNHVNRFYSQVPFLGRFEREKLGRKNLGLFATDETIDVIVSLNVFRVS